MVDSTAPTMVLVDAEALDSHTIQVSLQLNEPGAGTGGGCLRSAACRSGFPTAFKRIFSSSAGTARVAL